MKVTVNFEKTEGQIKPMHAVNNGPVCSVRKIGNFETYKELEIPYARNHDASFLATYGGEHTVDIHAVFPNFDADPYSEDSYDFACTDKYLGEIELAGTEVFYRLGTRIEHEIKKYNSLPPKDFKKWAIICEHIIKHYNYGWANGFHKNIQYWEIWNEPDLGYKDEVSPTWGGTQEQFLELFDITANHLKGNFPELKIGGPAVAGDKEWIEEFLQYCKENNIPMDFFSWHIYWRHPKGFEQDMLYMRNKLDEYGYTNCESILNEWNYLRGWVAEEFITTIREIQSLKGSCFDLAVMCVGQKNPVEMLMYYDARPGGFNGLWKAYTHDVLKGYYSFYAFSKLYKLGTCVQTNTDNENLFAAAAKNDDEKAIVFTYFDGNDDYESVEIDLELIEQHTSKITLKKYESVLVKIK